MKLIISHTKKNIGTPIPAKIQITSPCLLLSKITLNVDSTKLIEKKRESENPIDNRKKNNNRTTNNNDNNNNKKMLSVHKGGGDAKGQSNQTVLWKLSNHRWQGKNDCTCVTV